MRIPANAGAARSAVAMREQSHTSKARWRVEKDAIAEIRKRKAQIDSLKAEEQRYERAGELAKVAEIRYGKCRRRTASFRKRRSGWTKFRNMAGC